MLQLPDLYISKNWPVNLVACDARGSSIAVAGTHGPQCDVGSFINLLHIVLNANILMQISLDDLRTRFNSDDAFIIAGIAHYSGLHRRWRMFGNERQEESFTCHSGLDWWRQYIVVACHNNNCLASSV